MNDRQIDEFYNSSIHKKKTGPSRPPPFSKRPILDWLSGFFPSRKQWRFLPQVLSKKERYGILALTLAIGGLLLYLPIGAFYDQTQPAPDFGGSYTEGLLGKPQYINPLLVQTNDTDRDLSHLIYSGLLKYDPQGKIVPDLAESYEASGDGLEYTFTLKENLQWHDGAPLTANDVVFTIKVLQNNDYGSIQRINWQGIDVEKVNERVLKLKLTTRYAQFLNNATLGILPKHLWENIKPASFPLSDLNLRPIGSGPYRFKHLIKDRTGQIESYELKAFEAYVDGQPFINKITFKFYDSEDELVSAYNNNRIEGIGFLSNERIKRIKFSQRLSLRQIRLPRYFAAFFNPNESKILGDKNIRLALNYGTDKQAMIDQLLEGRGLVVNSPILKELILSDTPPKYGYDQAFAKQILANGGWKDANGDGIREKDNELLTVKIKTSNFPDLTRTAEILKQQWESLGFKVELQIETLAEIQQSIKSRAYEVLVFGEVLNLDPDPYIFWHSSKKKDGLNLALYDNKNADKLLEESRQTLNPVERGKKYEDFEKILLEDAPAVFLYSRYYIYFPSKKIKGNALDILPTPSSRFDNAHQWYIETKRIKKSSS